MTSLHFQTVPFPALPRATVQRWHWKCLCTRGYSYACVCEKQRGEGSTITASAGCSSHSVFPPSSILRPPSSILLLFSSLQRVSISFSFSLHRSFLSLSFSSYSYIIHDYLTFKSIHTHCLPPPISLHLSPSPQHQPPPPPPLPVNFYSNHKLDLYLCVPLHTCAYTQKYFRVIIKCWNTLMMSSVKFDDITESMGTL